MSPVVKRFFVRTPLPQLEEKEVRTAAGDVEIAAIHHELCFHTIWIPNTYSEELETKILWLLNPNPLEMERVKSSSSLEATDDERSIRIEIGPQNRFTSPASTNAVGVFTSSGIEGVTRIEMSRIYLISFTLPPPAEMRWNLVVALHDPMTESEYLTQPTFDTSSAAREEFSQVEDLEKANKDMGLALDEADIAEYKSLFWEKLGRSPTNVELFDLAQSNSEHSRHWFFRGELFVDGVKIPKSLMRMVKDTQNHSNKNNVIAFCDNSSGIKGGEVESQRVETNKKERTYSTRKSHRHVIYTAETHNFPTGVCPFPGAATGTGGRIRDVQAAGRGAHVVAGVAGYSFGNLHLPGYKLPWETATHDYPRNFALPRSVCIQASNGASDYGNKFGEPVIGGFARSVGMEVGAGAERIEFVKPIMFSGGIGAIENGHIKKIENPDPGTLVAKIGGPVYRIGVGGGSASSVNIQGGDSERAGGLDFGAVQRGDPEMEQKMNRALRTCVEMDDKNPILSIHDQGAGGNGNVLKELVENVGAVIEADRFTLGDPTLSLLELWGAEYQESNALLLRAEDRPLLQEICARERCPLDIVGEVTGDKRIVLKDFTDGSASDRNPVDLDLDLVLGDMPKKQFHLETVPRTLPPLRLRPDLDVLKALELVSRLPSVASKRYLTNKVDRSVTGLIAQQQCVGPFHTPLADVSVVAFSHYDTLGGALGIGEQPVKGIVDEECGARMSVGEALTNLVFAPITDLKDVKCSANWMWPAKVAGEGARLVRACQAMCSLMEALGVAVDGGKDSLGMAAKIGKDVVKSPGTLVVSAYAVCEDVRTVVTPDLKCTGGSGRLLYVRFGSDLEKNRLGGTALAQCFSETGNVCADLETPVKFVNAFRATQELIKSGLIRSGHDVSDGGLLMAILEMAFAGDASLDLSFSSSCNNPLEVFFAEELAIVLEVEDSDSVAERIENVFRKHEVKIEWIGKCTSEIRVAPMVAVRLNGVSVFKDMSLTRLRFNWEETSCQLEKLQTAEKCAEAEKQFLTNPRVPEWTPPASNSWSELNLKTPIIRNPVSAPRIAVLREEGSNGDREMGAAFAMAGFEVHDVCMEDLLRQNDDGFLDSFRGIAFVGGFSYGDVLGSAKGWAGSILFHERIKKEFERFFAREDSFSFGVCNGCQLMALLGWIGFTGEKPAEPSVFLEHNESGRFESRFSSVKIRKSPAIMLDGLEDSVLGVWVSHGEGKFTYGQNETLAELRGQNLIAMEYVDAEGQATVAYPANPNGSEAGVAGLCSPDGRHLALMPHPERCFLGWQWPHWNPTLGAQSDFAPWIQIFVNAFNWSSKKK